MKDAINNPFLAVEEAARFLRPKKRTLDNMRWMGTDPAFHKHGGRALLHFDELMQRLKEGRVTSISDYFGTLVIVTMASRSYAGRIVRIRVHSALLNCWEVAPPTVAMAFPGFPNLTSARFMAA
jgi:hypothetical protein